MNQKDIVRHKLVERIVEAYDKFDKEKKNLLKDKDDESINKN